MRGFSALRQLEAVNGLQESHAQALAEGRLVDAHTVSAGDKKITAEYIVIGTGERAKRQNVPGKEYIHDSTDFLSVDEFPKRLVAGDSFKVALKGGGVIECDYILEATGRQANADNLSLEDVGVVFSEKGIKVNEYLQSSVPNIYASGDVIDKRIPRLTPTASFESNYIAEHILGKKDPISYPAIPNLVFTLPRIAQVGGSLDAAEKEPEKFRIEVVPYGKGMLFDSSNEEDNEFTFIFDGDNHLAGAAFYGSEAASLVNFVTLAINTKVTGSELDHMIFAFPAQTYGLSAVLAPMMMK